MSLQDAKRALKTVQNRINKKFGTDTFVDTSIDHSYEVVSTGSAAIDDATGIGGLAIGRVYEIYGPESAGKSSFCYSVASEFQKAQPDKYIAYIDVEHALSLPYMADFGVNIDSDHLVFTQPSTAEEALEIYNELAASGACSLIILDSIGSMSTKAQLERGMDEKTMGAVAAVLGVAVNQIKDSCSKTKTTGIFINQVREKLSYGGGESTPGGRAAKHAYSMRIRVSKNDVITDASKKAIGQEMTVKFIKNKLGTPYATTNTKLIFGKGFDFEFEYVDIAEAYGVINKSGSWISFNDSQGNPVKFQGAVKTAMFFKENPAEFEYIKALTKEAQKATGPIVTIVPLAEGDDYDDEPE